MRGTSKPHRVDKTNLDFAQQKVTAIGLIKKPDDNAKKELAFRNKILAKKSEYERLAGELKVAEDEMKAAEIILKTRKEAHNSLQKVETDRLKAYTDQYDALKRSVDLLIASGNSFGEDHSSFLTRR